MALTDREVDRARRAWDEGDDGGFVAFANDSQCSVTALERKVLDIGRARFGRALAVEAEQYGESGNT